MRQLDFNNAFLNGFLKEDIYMEQPPSFVNPSHPTWVYKLHRALYGLKQVPRAWFECLHSKLLTLGFHSSKAHTSLFLKLESEHSLYILILVDDVLITSSSATQVQDFIPQLQTSFALKDLGVPSYFLRLELTYTFQGVLLSQHNYIIDVLQKDHMYQAKPISTPMANGASFSSYIGDVFGDPHLYCSIVGSLQYATITQPKIAFAINCVCQFMHQQL